VPADISRVVLARVSRHSRLVCLGLNVDNNDCDCNAAKQCGSHERAYWPFLSRGPKDRNRGVDFHPDIGSGVTRPLWWTQPSSGKMGITDDFSRALTTLNYQRDKLMN